jgi:hypothetical protein
MRPVEIILNIISTFVNVTMYSHYNNTMLIKIKFQKSLLGKLTILYL